MRDSVAVTRVGAGVVSDCGEWIGGEWRKASRDGGVRIVSDFRELTVRAPTLTPNADVGVNTPGPTSPFEADVKAHGMTVEASDADDYT